MPKRVWSRGRTHAVLSYTKKLLALKNPFEVPFLPREEVALGHAQQEEITSAAADFKRDIDSTSGNSLAQNTEKAAGGAAAGTFKPKPDALTAALAAETGSGEKALEASQTLSASPEAGGKGGKGVLDLGGSPGLGGLSKLVGGPGAYHNLLFAPTAYEGWVIYFLYVYFASEKFPDLLLRFVASVVCSICLLCLSFDFGLPSSLCVLLVAAGIAGGLTAGPWTVAPLLEPLPEAYRKRATQLVRQFSVGWLALLLFAAHLVVNLILTQLVDLLFGSTVTTSKAIMYVILLCAGTYPYFYLILDKLDPSQMNVGVA
ncbi:MAG: hypothetical protein KVP17_003262 [Porospora cf. gigantea B]|uniref:uncharacterized protein n=1 Tax=Porospora cf. gigantea B TaxID=2853592 RepID=UPI0035718EA1|nr:MAG: hypothetical protein KVP17_003262 [Porospora cf. gigantea B]